MFVHLSMLFFLYCIISMRCTIYVLSSWWVQVPHGVRSVIHVPRAGGRNASRRVLRADQPQTTSDHPACSDFDSIMEDFEGDFEDECSDNRERNRRYLESMGLQPLVPPKQRSAPKKQKATRKRKAIQVVEAEEEGEEQPTKIARAVDEETGEETILRRSQRTRGKKVDYKDESLALGRALPGLASVKAGLKEMTTDPRTVNKRVHDP